MEAIRQEISELSSTYIFPVGSPMADSPMPPITRANLRTLSAPLGALMQSMRVEECVGASSEISAIDVDCKVRVAFIAAQERQSDAFIMWDPQQKCIVNVFTHGDCIAVLFYGGTDASRVASIANSSLREWLSGPRTIEKLQRRPWPGVLIAVSPEDTLETCVGKLCRHRIRRIAIVDPRGQGGASIMAMCPLRSLFGVLIRKLDLALSHQEGALPKSVRGIVGEVDPLVRGVLEVVGTPYRSVFDVPLLHLTPLLKELHPRFNPENASSVEENDSILVALELLLSQRRYSLPVMRDRVIVDVVTRQDILRMEADGVYAMDVTVRRALAFRPQSAPVVCGWRTPLKDIVTHMLSRQIDELCVIHDDSFGLEGFVSMLAIVNLLFDAMDSTL